MQAAFIGPNSPLCVALVFLQIVQIRTSKIIVLVIGQTVRYCSPQLTISVSLYNQVSADN